MTGRRRISREAIIEAATAILMAEGANGLTFQALASRLGVTKQAVIYWYPSKQDLARDLFLPSLAAETDAVVSALAGAASAADAIARFVRALVAHHLSDLPRFRYTYLSPQLDTQAPQITRDIRNDIHATTGRMYAALEAAIAADADFDAGGSARRDAAAIHAAVIGLLTMLALADAVADPLAHETGALVDALVHLLTGRGPA